MDWFNNHDLFFKECRNGQKWQEYVGKYLNDNGVKVEVEPLTLREDVSDREDYINTKDIVMQPGGVIEVKSVRLDFTDVNSFPYDPAIIDTVNGYDRKDPKPMLYVCVSQITGGMIATRGDRTSLWTTSAKWDRVRGFQEYFYNCSLEHWRTLDWFIPSAIAYQNRLREKETHENKRHNVPSEQS